MTMTMTIDDLSSNFDCYQNKGWLTVSTRDTCIRQYFGTERLAKVMPNDQLVFTIGATQRGDSFELNKVIEHHISNARFPVLYAKTTNGGRDANYPACKIRDESVGKVLRVILDVEREVKRITESLNV